MNGAQSRSRTPAWLWGAALLVLGVCGGTIISLWAMRLPQRVLKAQQEMKLPPAPQTVAPRTVGPQAVVPRTLARPAAPRQMMTEEFFKKHVMPLLELEHSRNLAAIDSARRRLDDKFRGYAESVPQFVSELNSLSIKYRLVKALVQDNVDSSHEMRQVAAGLFAKHILSDSQLHADVEDLVAQFHHDLDANRDLILVALGQGVALASVSDPTAASSRELLARESREELHKFVEARAEQTPAATLEALGHGIIAEEAVRRLVTDAIASRVAASSGEAAKSPDGVSKGAAVAGTAAGVLAGAADYWLLQARFEAALTNDCRSALDKMRDTLWADPRNGLEANFTGLVELAHEAHEMALQRALLAGAQ